MAAAEAAEADTDVLVLVLVLVETAAVATGAGAVVEAVVAAGFLLPNRPPSMPVVGFLPAAAVACAEAEVEAGGIVEDCMEAVALELIILSQVDPFWTAKGAAEEVAALLLVVEAVEAARAA